MLIMVSVFGGFASGDLVMFEQMGFGLGGGAHRRHHHPLDHGPASLHLLGKANWYLPSCLEWLPTLRLDTSETR